MKELFLAFLCWCFAKLGFNKITIHTDETDENVVALYLEKEPCGCCKHE